MENVGYKGALELANCTEAEVTTNCPGWKVKFISNGIPPIEGAVERKKKGERIESVHFSERFGSVKRISLPVEVIVPFHCHPFESEY